MIDTMILLLVAHFLFDYALQGDFMAKAKNLNAPMFGVPWIWPMASHCFIHAAAVYFITGSYLLGALEFICHFYIDSAKCVRMITFGQDQTLHVGLKVVYASTLLLGIVP